MEHLSVNHTEAILGTLWIKKLMISSDKNKASHYYWDAYSNQAWINYYYLKEIQQFIWSFKVRKWTRSFSSKFNTCGQSSVKRY